MISAGGIIGRNVNFSQKIEFLGAIANSYPGTTSQVTEDFTSNKLPPLEEDDFLVIVYGCGHTASVSLSIVNSGWTTLTSNYINATTADTNMIVAYKKMGPTPDSNVIVSSAGSTAAGPGFVLMAFRNVDPVTPFDVANTSSSATNSHLVNPAAITPVTRNALILCAGFGGVIDSQASVNKYTTMYDSSDLEQFNSVGYGDTTDGVCGMGFYSKWTSGSFDPAAWTSSAADGTSYSYQSVTMALRPRTPKGMLRLDIPYKIGIGQ